MDPKSRPKSIKACSGGVSKRDLKNGPSPGSGKVRFCNYLLHFSKVGGLKKDTFLGTILRPFGRQNRWKQGSRTASKKVLKIDTHFTRFWVHFGDHFWVESRSFAGRRISVCCMLGPGKLDISKWVPKSTMLGPKIDDFRCIFFDSFFLILCLILFLGQADQIREEHTQSTHRAHAEP